MASEKYHRAAEILEKEFALKKSMIEEACVDKNGEPIPWYTYPAIEYIKQIDISDKRIFEFGSGNSSLFWASLAKEVVSIEEDGSWYQSRLEQKKMNMRIIFEENNENYASSILKEEGLFDVIIIDGKVRDMCCKAALQKIKENGLIILDNSDWGRKIDEIGSAVKILKRADLIQVDFCGFGPINDYAWCTSFFFKRKFNFRSKNDPLQPANIIGGIHQL